jgi:GntR family transcriptional regulator, transcriptional repressor for pyruvate dehydrogenase complex
VLYKEIKPKKIYEQVAEAIFDMIKEGVLKPGDKLDSVQQLAENFNVGRAAIREALSALRAMGLIEMKQGEGTYVREFDPAMLSFPISIAVLMRKEDIAHLLEVRKLLEIGAAGVAARKRTEKDLQAMEHALNRMRKALGDEELGEQADFLFHIAIAAASQNPILVSLMNNVSGMMVETMRETRRLWLFSKHTTSEQLLEDHIQIFEAIKEQNAELAQERMRAHLGNVEKVLAKFIQ